MNRDDMLRRLEAGEDPLELSIKKWQDIVDGKGIDGGVANCALCERYSKYANANRNESTSAQDELKQFAQKELDFLKSLRKR